MNDYAQWHRKIGNITYSAQQQQNQQQINQRRNFIIASQQFETLKIMSQCSIPFIEIVAICWVFINFKE